MLWGDTMRVTEQFKDEAEAFDEFIRGVGTVYEISKFNYWDGIAEDADELGNRLQLINEITYRLIRKAAKGYSDE